MTSSRSIHIILPNLLYKVSYVITLCLSMIPITVSWCLNKGCRQKYIIIFLSHQFGLTNILICQGLIAPLYLPSYYMFGTLWFIYARLRNQMVALCLINNIIKYIGEILNTYHKYMEISLWSYYILLLITVSINVTSIQTTKL